ncbi:MAG TPA: nitrite reductase large subunit NirB [Burkholderiales bacterium]
MTRPRLVVVGNGMAGIRTVEELLARVPDLYDVVVFGSEPHGNYNRILLSPVLAGEKTVNDIMLNGVDWYAKHGIRLHAGKAVTAIHRRKKIVEAADGTTERYDRLLLATGSSPIMLPLPGKELPGVVTFRDIEDVNRMLAAAGDGGGNAVVVGGGLLGLEAANGLAKRGMNVTVVHLLATLMERQLDAPAAGLLQRELENRGLRFLLEHQTEAVVGDDRVRAVRFKNGLEVPADLVVMSVGIRPNVEVAKAAGLYCQRGVVVNDTMQTFDPAIYAVGECVEHRGATYGLVAPLFEQAKVCANHLARAGSARYEGSLTATKLKVTGIEVYSAGDFQGDADSESLVFQDAARGVYKKVVLRDNRVCGSVLIGDTVDGPWYFQLLRDGTDVTTLREHLLFGQAHVGDSGHGPANKVASMPSDAEICGCNGVCKGTIVQAIVEKGLFTLEEVRAHTKASSSCGSCTGLVEQILASTVGDASPTQKKKPMCPCTDFTHDEVRQAIRANALKSMRAVTDFLEWKTPDGCQKCRPALNYYLVCAWPAEYVDDGRSRFINERAHANIQKDGTYSVVPRIWGGVTTPSELRAIAEVAERYDVPTVKFTGGQRIDLLGVKKEDLPKVWRDLGKAGLVSGHAYGKALRTVKTCVGSEWCRFGTQDSTAMGIKIEKMTWGAWTPHKVKMAVSGCPRNCAEATIKDFGVVAVESGWELHVGGNGGVKVRVTDLLCKVSTMEEVLEYCAAYMQLYREEARYLERTAPWLERVGLEYVKGRIVEDENGRRALAARFAESQRVAQVDPWAERAAGCEHDEFAPISLAS